MTIKKKRKRGGVLWFGAVMTTRHIPKLKTAPTKTLVAVGIAITLGFSAICFVFLQDAARRDHEQAKAVATNLIASIRSEIARNIEQYDLSLQAVVDGLQMPELERIDPALRQIILFDRSATARDLGSIRVLNGEGNVTIESRTLETRSDNFSQRSYFKFHKNNASMGLHISGPWLTKRGEYTLSISRRLNKPDGSFQGVVVGSMNLSYFHRLLKNINLAPGDTLSLLDSTGTVIMRSPFDISAVGRDISNTAVFGYMTGTPFMSDSPVGSTDAVSSLDGVKRLFVFQQIGDHPLHILAGLSHESIYADWWRVTWVIGSLNLALCVITISLIVFLARALKLSTVAEHDRAIMATTDGLTGICNRRRFDELFENEWQRSQRAQTPIALLMIDADSFKAFNDEHGHQAGDAALIAIAQCIEGGARRASDFAARYGGEEFVVLLPGEFVEGALHVAEEIRAAVLSLRAQQQGQPNVNPTISLGVASLIPQVGLSPADLIKLADAALYKAKEQGRNCCVIGSALASVSNKKLAA